MIEAAYTLRGPIPAGLWGFVVDGIVAGTGVQQATVLFEARLRPRNAGGSSQDQILASLQHTFLRDSGNPFSAVNFSSSVPGVAGAAQAGDFLVFRTTAVGGDPGAEYILNGDGLNANGSIPRLDLPQ
jgi:hypothetical protein